MSRPDAVQAVRQARFRVRLWWQFSVKPRLARRTWLTGRLPWRIWCRLCAWNAATVIHELARRSDRPLTFVQIGSNDGVLNDPLHDTIRARHWSGLLVEPIPRLFEELTANYRDVPGVRTANVAIGRTDGAATMYAVDRRPGDPDWVEQIASLDRDVVLRHTYAMPDLEGRIVPTEVETVRLPSLLTREGIASVDVMHIDAEGADDEVIRQIDMAAPWAPRYLLYEAKHLGVERYLSNRSRLRAAGYTVVSIWPDELAYRRP